MKSSSKLPKCPVKGWKWLPSGVEVRRGDIYINSNGEHLKAKNGDGTTVGPQKYDSWTGYIRRKAVRPTTKQGGGK